MPKITRGGRATNAGLSPASKIETSVPQTHPVETAPAAEPVEIDREMVPAEEWVGPSLPSPRRWGWCDHCGWYWH